MKSISVVAAFALGLLALIAGCKSTDPGEARQEAGNELRAYLQNEISDAGRREAALALFDELDRELTAFQDDVQDFRKQMGELSPRRDATREEALALYDACVERREERRGKVLDLHFKLRAALTDAEWPGYMERELALLKANTRTPRTGAAAGVTDEEG